ncbi:MAG: iron ABC transporter permease [Micrococcales bacterium]|nr:iron ABC transporter permease [Micrococcales bacterium]
MDRPRHRLTAARHALGWGLAAGLPLVFLAVFFAWPVAVMVGRGFVADGALDLGGFGEVFSRPRTWRVVGLTLLQAGLTTVVCVVLGVPGAHTLYRAGPFRGRTALRAFVTVPFVLPTVVVGVAFRALLQPSGPLGFLGLDHTLVGIVAALSFFNYSVVVRGVGGLWERLDPRAEQAARALGASSVRVFATVTLPALTPAVAAAAALVFLFSATSFGTVLVLGGPRFGTVETEIYLQTTQFLNLRAAAVLSVTQLVVVAAVLAVAARARAARERALPLAQPDPVRGAGSRTSRGGSHLARRPGGSALAAVVTGVVVCWLALPILALVARSLRVGDGWGLDHYAALARPAPGLGSTSALDAAVTSLRVAVDATGLALLVGGLLAVVLSRRPARTAARRLLAGFDALVMAPLGVSAVTVGFGLLLSMHHPFGLPVDLRGHPLLVPVAQATVAVPLVVRTVLPVLRAVDPRQREAAATLGAPPGRVLATVDAPAGLRALGLAAGFAFAVSLGEFGATSFLARPDQPTLPVVVFRLIGRPGLESSGQALAAAVLLAALSAAAVAVFEHLRARTVGATW